MRLHVLSRHPTVVHWHGSNFIFTLFLGTYLFWKAMLIGIMASEKKWNYDEFGVERKH
jgi:hypothetical protein